MHIRWLLIFVLFSMKAVEWIKKPCGAALKYSIPPKVIAELDLASLQL